MKYVLLIHHDEKAIAGLPSGAGDQLTRESLAYDIALEQKGHLVTANALRPSTLTKCVSRRGRKPLVTDGPFAETKEQLIGFLLIEAADMDEAVRLAGDLPLARTGTVEIRPAYSIREEC
ncbi:MAG: YciI family protein [Rhizobiaceae bacterium]|nr:YciI family protein [Rhizobiaceae bacterium]